MSIVVEFDASSLVSPVVHDLQAGGVTPVMAIERALEAHIFECFQTTLKGRLIKPPRIRLHASYYKNRFANLTSLAKTGYETWYTEVCCSTATGDKIEDLEISSSGIDIVPIDYGFGVSRAVQEKISPLKKQINHTYRINHLHVGKDVFKKIIDTLSSLNALPQPLIANFTPGPDIRGNRTVSYDNIITGSRKFCECARGFHTAMQVHIEEIMPQYVPGSWPEKAASMFDDVMYESDICHLCIAREKGAEEAVRYYGGSIETYFPAFMDQIVHDLGVDEKTARREVMHILNLSRWVRESALYGVIRELFPDQRVLREASPDWLGRMRIDIYLPELKLAIEHQGEQHFRPIPMFGGEKAHAKVVERDAMKRKLCLDNGVTVIDVRFDAPITKSALRQRLSKFVGF